MTEVLNPFQGNLFQRSSAPTISNRRFLELTLPHLQSGRDGSAPGAQHAAVVKLLSIFAALEKQRDEWAKHERIQVQEYVSIIKAAYNGELEGVRSHLQHNAEAIHERTQGGRNALHAASTNGHLEIVQLLVEATLNINREDATGITPLRMSVASNHVEVTKYLLRQKADPNKADHTGWTPLHSAALNGHADIIKWLKTSGADVTKQTECGYTALFLSALNGHVDCVTSLVEIEAGTSDMQATRCRHQLDMVDEAGFSALHCAALKGHVEITNIILRMGASPAQKSESGMVPFALAFAEGHLSCMRELLDFMELDDVTEAFATAISKGHYRNSVMRYFTLYFESNMWSRLHNAASDGETELLRSLIEECRDIDEQAGGQGCTPLILAIWQGRLESVKILIEEGNANVNKPDNNGCSPLHIASELRNEEVMTFLLANGAQPDALNNEGKAALHDSCFEGNLNVIKLLINAGVDVDIKVSKEDSTCHTPLQFAARGGHIECVKLLLDEGAHIETPGPDTYSALLAAASRNQEEVIKYLLGKDANVHVTDKKGDSVLFWSALYNNIDLLKKCLEDGRVDTNAKNSSGQTALHVASGFGHIDAVKLLVHNHAEIDTKDNDECTPLQNAAECNRAEVVAYLLENGADIEHKDCDGRSPLHRAASAASIDSVKLLMERGADITAKAEDGATPLHLAVAELTEDSDFDFPLELEAGEKGDNAKCVEYLLDKGADINATDDLGNTPLIYAVDQSVYDCAQILISRGADVDAKTNSHITALHISVGRGNSGILRLILSQSRACLEVVNEDQWTPLQEAIYNDKVECVRLLCDYGANLEDPSINGETPLYLAVKMKSVEIVNLLLEKGVNSASTLYENETPLHLAVAEGYRDIVELLIDHGADLDARITTSDYNVFHIASETGQEECLQFLVDTVIWIDDGDGDAGQRLERRLLLDSTLKTMHTPLHCAIHGGHLECVQILCEAGANVDAQSISGETPLQLASEMKHDGIVKCLLAFHADVNKANNTGITALHIAASNGLEELLGTLLESNADVNVQSEEGWTPLHMSVKAGHVEITSILIASGSNIHGETGNGDTLIHIAAEWNLPEMLQYLIENGVSIDKTNKMGYTALLLASSEGHPGCIDFLLQNGAGVNKQSNHNSTPLLLAAENGHQSCVEKLAAFGADPTKRDNDGDSLVHVASLGGRFETLAYVLDLEGMSDLISSKSNTGHLPLHYAAREGNLDCVKLLITLGVSQEYREEGGRSSSLFDEQDCKGKTPLHLAVEGGFSPVIEALIEEGADLNIQNKDGQTCLHLAVKQWGSPENPDKNVQTSDGFELVVSRYPEYEPFTENEKLLLYLLDKGAICTTFDASGNTPIHYTSTHRLWQLVVSRIPKEERNDLLEELDVESKRIKRTGRKVIGTEGDEIPLSRYGVQLTVPPGALDKDQDISVRLIETCPVPGIEGVETMASFGVELKPAGLKFKHPVQIKLPHCASIVDTTDAKVLLYHVKGGEFTTQEVTAGNLVEIPACTVREKELELHIDEFCFWIPRIKSSRGKKMMCCPYSKITPDRSANLRLYLANDVKGVEKDLKKSKRLQGANQMGDPEPYLVEWRNGDVHVAVMNKNREEEMKSISIEKIRPGHQTYIDFAELKTEHYENLGMRVFQITETNIACTNPLEKAPETEAPGNDAEGSAQRVTQLELLKLSEIISHEKYTELCVRLGCSLTYADNKLATHFKDYNKALLEVINKWNQRTRRNHRDKLIKVLEEADVAGLITKIFPDYVHDHEPAVPKND